MRYRLLEDYIPQYIQLARKRFNRQEIKPYQPTMPPIHEDLGGLSLIEVELEMQAIEKRIEKGIVQPEGIDGLHYRLARLEAQKEVLRRREAKA